MLVEFADELDGEVTGVLRNENGSPLERVSGVVVDLVPGERVAYAFVFTIPEAEIYQATFEVGPDESRPVGFTTVDDPVQVQAGEEAPDVDGEEVAGSVLVFASTTWCQSDSCQPMIDVARSVAPESLVVVEPFIDIEVEEESDLELTPTVLDWGLPSQPWLFVVDDAGVISALFEGGVTEAELREALES